MQFIKSLKTIQNQDQPLVGGKAFSLGLLFKTGANVPDGFVVTSHAFRKFFEEADIGQEVHAMWDTINVDDIESLERHSEKIRGVIENSLIPEEIKKEVMSAYKSLGETAVAVRSSATAEDSSIASWAGELESYLYVTQTDLLDKIKLCWASLYTPRAIVYRAKRDMTKTDISVAVIVQKMVNSQISGVSFTVNPVTRDQNDMVIEAVYGLGEALVQGIVTPDRYNVDKKENVIVDIVINAQKKMYVQNKTGGTNEVKVPKKKQLHQKLTGKEIITLLEVCQKIEQHFGSPQDIEWAIEDGKFYIVQSRPITTLISDFRIQDRKVSKASQIRRDDYHYFGLWKQDMFSAYFFIFWLEKKLNQTLKLNLSDGGLLIMDGHVFIKNEVLTLIKKHLDSIIASRDYGFFKKLEQLAESTFQLRLEIAQNTETKGATNRTLEEWVLSARKIIFFWVYSFILSDFLDQWLFQSARKCGINENDLVYLIVYRPTLFNKQKEEALKIKHELHNKGIISNRKFSIQEVVKKIQKDKSLYEKVREHVSKFSWIELQNFKGDIFSIEKLLEQIKHLPKTSMERKTIKYQKPSVELRYLIKVAIPIAYLRQYSAEIFSIFTEKSLRFLNQVAKSLKVSYEDMLYLTPSEVEKTLINKESCDIATLIQQRKESGYCIFLNKEKLVLLDNQHEIQTMYNMLIPKPAPSAKILKGVTGNGGKAKGMARVILNANDFHKFQKGDVLVTTMTTPDFVLLMQQSSAIVTDVGGLLSHASIISRELGRPCVIGTQFATTIIKDGDLVEVDADNGVVKILK